MPDFIICPYVDCLEFTRQALADFLKQLEGTASVLLVDNGSKERPFDDLEPASRIFHWHHEPPLPSLSATWNRALDFVWETGADHCLVPNNDVHLHPSTYALLLQAMHESEALFVSAVNAGGIPDPYKYDLSSRGGPDFSCFLISKEGHRKYRFDDQFTYCNDLDMHRRYMLGGDGSRIFSVDVPYNHLNGGSNTVKAATSEAAKRIHQTAEEHRRRYARKWGGPVNGEKWLKPYANEPVRGGVCTTTPDLQRHGCGGSHPSDDTPPSQSVDPSLGTSEDKPLGGPS